MLCLRVSKFVPRLRSHLVQESRKRAAGLRAVACLPGIERRFQLGIQAPRYSTRQPVTGDALAQLVNCLDNLRWQRQRRERAGLCGEAVAIERVPVADAKLVSRSGCEAGEFDAVGRDVLLILNR